MGESLGSWLETRNLASIGRVIRGNVKLINHVAQKSAEENYSVPCWFYRRNHRQLTKLQGGS